MTVPLWVKTGTATPLDLQPSSCPLCLSEKAGILLHGFPSPALSVGVRDLLLE